MFRYFTYSGSYRWIGVLNKLVMSYNHTIHRSLPPSMTPSEASLSKNVRQVWEHQEKRQPIPSSQALKSFRKKLNVGDFVRISSVKGIFAKGYTANWSEEIFSIVDIDERSLPVMYKIVDSNKEILKGKFYKEELQKVTQPTSYAIEKLFPNRKKQNGKQMRLASLVGYLGKHWVYDIHKL